MRIEIKNLRDLYDFANLLIESIGGRLPKGMSITLLLDKEVMDVISSEFTHSPQMKLHAFSGSNFSLDIMGVLFHLKTKSWYDLEIEKTTGELNR